MDMDLPGVRNILTVESILDEVQHPLHPCKYPAQVKTNSYEFVSAIIHYVGSAHSNELQDLIRGEKSEVDKLVAKFEKLINVTQPIAKIKSNSLASTSAIHTTKSQSQASSSSTSTKDGTPQKSQKKGSKDQFKKGNVSHSISSALQLDATSSSMNNPKANFVRFMAAFIVKLYDSKTFPGRIITSQRKNDLGDYIVNCYRDYKNLAGHENYWGQRIALNKDYKEIFVHAVPEKDNRSIIDDSDDDELEVMPFMNSAAVGRTCIPIEASLLNLPTGKKIEFKEAELEEQNLKVCQLEHKLQAAKTELEKLVNELTELKMQHHSEEEAKQTIQLIKQTKSGFSTFEAAKQLISIFEKLKEIIASEKMNLTPMQLMEKITKINVTEALRVDKVLNETLMDLTTGSEVVVEQSSSQPENANLIEPTSATQNVGFVNEGNNKDINDDAIPNDSQKEVVEIDKALIREAESVVGKRMITDMEKEVEIKRKRHEDSTAVNNLLDELNNV